ncbi:MAG: PIN domain-containing protein [Gracilimonas sp.]|uniref:PIN domain-containing protein n=1 Tax=Gracilimonas sp. TaxID=1974203 RepID=UPI00375354CE|nr:PIN domain-containing protein [Gracilimonas sp.]
MNEEPEPYDYKEQLENELKQKFPGIQEKWESLTNELGPALYDHVRNQSHQEILKIEGFGELHFSLVIDTNFIFGQIKGSVTKNISLEETFIYKLINCSFVTVYAPFKLKEELFEKIDRVLKRGNEQAANHADILLNNLVMMDAQWIEDWKIAQRTIGHEDPDDVSFLALSLHTSSHGILSFDKIFKSQNLTKTWGIDDAEKVIHTFNHGITSLAVVGASISIVELLYKFVSFISKVILDVVLGIITALMGITALTIHSLGQIPIEIIIGLAGIFIAGLFLSDDLRQGGKDLMDTIFDKIRSYSSELAEFLSELKELILEFWEIFKPFGITTVELFAYLSHEVQLMHEQMIELEGK